MVSLTKRFDDRVLQQVPSWTVELGASSLSSAPFQSLNATATQCNYQIQAPSQSVYLDRVVQWQQTVGVTMTVDCSLAPVAPFQIVTPGRDFSLCASPLHALVGSMTATIGDAVVSSNPLQSRELMDLLSDTPLDREWRTYPCALDVYADYNDAFGTLMNPIAGFDSASTNAMIGNGSWPLVFTNPAGSVTTPYTDSFGNAVTFTAGGIPQLASGAGDLTRVQVYFQFTSTEPLQMSPFIWREVYERKTGLSQLTNIGVIMNLASALNSHLIRSTSKNGRFITSYALNNIGTTGTPFGGSSLSSQFLSPPPELPLSPINIVDYQSVLPYVYPFAPITTQSVSIGPIVTQSLSLPSIPDWLVIAVQPTPAYMMTAGARTQATWYLPITAMNATWSNVTGLLSSQTQQQLFGICKANGVKMSWDQWRGYAQTSTAGKEGKVQLTGGPMVLRPGIDLTLPPGQASGQSNGQWTFSVQLQVDTSAIPLSVLQDPLWGMQTTVLTVNSGYMQTSRGSTRLNTGPIMGLGTVPTPSDALMGIPVAGPVHRPEFTQLTDGSRLIGSGGGRRRMRMSDRVM